MDTIDEWASETFGCAQLGDARLTARAVEMAAAVARRPGGTITATMRNGAAKEAAYRFVENSRVDPSALVAAVGEASALRSTDEASVLVAIDQTDLTFMDRKQIRGLGPDGAGNKGPLAATQVMTSLAMNEAGTPTGLLDLRYWLRSDEKAPSWKEDSRPAEERESWKWVEAMRAVGERAQGSPGTRLWYVADRGADCAVCFREIIEQDALMTIRASQDRVIEHKGRRRRLFSTLRRQPVVGSVHITLPRREDRPKRRARMEIRAATDIALRLDDDWFVVNALQLREVSHVPRDQTPVCWILLTTHPLSSTADCRRVLRSYTFRWRVEEFHKSWKSGLCNVESSQLRSFEAIQRWATILAAVAARAERLKQLSRETPDLDARVEFSQDELDAAILYTEAKSYELGESMSLKEAVRLVAMAGGYMGRRGDGPPGTITIRRGLERIVPAAEVLRLQRARNG